MELMNFPNELFLQNFMKINQQTFVSDRFIPYRSRTPSASVLDSTSLTNENQNRLFASSLHKQIHPPKKYVCTKTFSTREETLKTFLMNLPKSYSKLPIIEKPEQIKAYKVLGATDLLNNFYSNVLDWSKTDLLSIGISTDLYLHNEVIQNAIIELKRFYHTFVTSTKFTPEGELVCCGDDEGYLEIFDVQKSVSARLYRAHKNRIGCMEFTPQNLLITGSKDQTIHIHDLREAQPIVAELKSHRGQICGLTFRDNYLASGGNDNKVCVWDLRVGKALGHHSHHSSAVKAISWCPYKSNILVSGGGVKDKKIVVWNADTLEKQMQMTQNGPIQAINWRNSTHQMITAQGRKQGYILTHNTFAQKKIRRKKFIGHNGRILGLCVSKNKDNIICSIGSDEVIRYWNFDQNKKYQYEQSGDSDTTKPKQTDSQHQNAVNISQMIR